MWKVKAPKLRQKRTLLKIWRFYFLQNRRSVLKIARSFLCECCLRCGRNSTDDWCRPQRCCSSWRAESWEGVRLEKRTSEQNIWRRYTFFRLRRTGEKEKMQPQWEDNRTIMLLWLEKRERKGADEIEIEIVSSIMTTNDRIWRKKAEYSMANEATVTAMSRLIEQTRNYSFRLFSVKLIIH